MKMVYCLAGAVVIAGAAAVFGSKMRATPESRASSASSSNRPALDELQPFGAPSDEAPSADDVLAGVVLEKLDVPSYTYLRIGSPGSGGQWAAVSTAKIEVGQNVRFRSQTVMTDFQSRVLKRTFETIRFGVLDGSGSVAEGTELPPGHPSLAGADPDPKAVVQVGKVDKASGPNARRVAEIFAQKKQLAGKSVRVRGVIVKVTSGVMGKNFAHIKDGSGAPASKDDDLTVTSTEPMQRGQTLLLEGKLELDRDLGAGYAYDAILADAKIVE